VKTTGMVHGTETSFFRDFVDNSDLRLGNALLTEEGRRSFNRIKNEIEHDLGWILGYSLQERAEKLLRMAMIMHAVSQILSEIAREEDNKTSQ